MSCVVAYFSICTISLLLNFITYKLGSLKKNGLRYSVCSYLNSTCIYYFINNILYGFNVSYREDKKHAFLELLPALFRSCVRNPVMSGQIIEVLRNLTCRTTNTNSTGVSVFVYSVLGNIYFYFVCSL